MMKIIVPSWKLSRAWESCRTTTNEQRLAIWKDKFKEHAIANDISVDELLMLEAKGLKLIKLWKERFANATSKFLAQKSAATSTRTADVRTTPALQVIVGDRRGDNSRSNKDDTQARSESSSANSRAGRRWKPGAV